MLFNSIDFAIFLPIVFIIYWFFVHKKLKGQNLFVLVSSYVFYAWWDWRFLALIIFSTLVDYFIGLSIHNQIHSSKRKYLLWVSILINLGFLGFFKYYNFFIENFVTAFTFFGNSLEHRSLNIILPVGISFYTFQTLSYTIDIYNKKLKPTKDIVAFASFIAFFPQLVAGPIERARNLLPQFETKRQFSYDKAVDGLKQILWGLFKKMVIADNCAVFVDEFFGNYEAFSGSTLLLGAFFFTVQIYCDFSGYSDIAIGVSRLFGFNLMKNFAFPYFSRDIAEFWRRWHISLTTWFRDYVYIPLGGSQVSKLKVIRNVLIVFLISGFWHGANWTFIIWGLINALLFLPLIITNKNKTYVDIVAQGKSLPSLKEFFQMAVTFSIALMAWIFFRANSVSDAFNYIKTIFSETLFSFPSFKNMHSAVVLLLLISLFFIIEWFGREKDFALKSLFVNQPRWVRWSFFYMIVACIFYFHTSQKQFIYFQF
jgi:D-alanyl-lipoteichoic acid acyltransferase DltB (MBOAT superfamily)